MLKQPIAGITFYRGYRIIFDGERFAVIEDATGRVVATDFYTIRAAKATVDVICSTAGA